MFFYYNDINFNAWLSLLKTCVHYFLFFHHMIALEKLWKMFLFHLKSSVHVRDIPIFVFRCYPLFLPVGHCFRGWLKINLKFYGVIICLNKNLITHFVWYLGKERRYDIETLPIDRVLNKEHLYGKSCRKCAPKPSPRPLINFRK